MRTALTVALVVLCSTGALASSLYGTGNANVPVKPHGFDGEQPTNVCVFMNQAPWGTTTLEDVLGAYSVPYFVHNSASMGAIDLSVYDKVIIACEQDDQFYADLEANQAWFEDYMADGGCMLLATAALWASPCYTTVWPGGFTPTANTSCINTVQIELPAHPLFNDPLLVVPGDMQGWSCSSHGDFINVPTGAVVLVTNQEHVFDTPAVFEFNWGQGGALASTAPIDWVGPSNPYTINTILYMCGGSTPVEDSTWGVVKALYR
jgi:hypothetical protein